MPGKNRNYTRELLLPWPPPAAVSFRYHSILASRISVSIFPSVCTFQRTLHDAVPQDFNLRLNAKCWLTARRMKWWLFSRNPVNRERIARLQRQAEHERAHREEQQVVEEEAQRRRQAEVEHLESRSLL